MDSDLGGKTRYIVADAADLPPGQRKIVKIAGREIGIFNINGNFHALRNLCPTGEAPSAAAGSAPL